MHGRMDTENKQLLEQAEKIRKGYSSVLVDEDEEQLTFLDEINKLLQIIFKDAPVDVYTVLKDGELDKWKKAKWKRRFSKFISSVSLRGILYFGLLATITGFLVSEAIPFYAIAGAVTSKTILKAILTEVSFIFLSAYRAVGKLETIGVGILRAAVFCLMLFVITSEVQMQGAGDISKINRISEQISTIERQIESKEKEIKFYMDKNWGNNTRQRIVERDKLAEQLRELKERQVQEGASQEVASLVQYKMYGKAAFRVILMFISVLVSRRIFRF